MNMTLEKALELGYRAGFISACNWPEPCSQDVDSPSFAIELRVFIEKHMPIFRQSDGPGEEFASWLEREMPEGTVIGNPKWWADRIARQFPKHNRPALAALCERNPAPDASVPLVPTSATEVFVGQAQEKAEPVASVFEAIENIDSREANLSPPRYAVKGRINGEYYGFDCGYYESGKRRAEWLAETLNKAISTAPPAERVRVPDGWIDRHKIAAGDCPPQSMVILVSSIRRMLSAAPEADHD